MLYLPQGTVKVNDLLSFVTRREKPMYDRREMAEGRFRTLLLKWLTKLPPDGWEGTSHQLGDALYAFGERHRLYAYVPLCPGRKVAAMSEFLSANGFTLTHRRTKHVRTAPHRTAPSCSPAPGRGVKSLGDAIVDRMG